MVKKIFAQTYLWILLLLLYSPIVIIVIYSFTEAKVLGNWTGFSTKLYSSLFTTGAHHSLMNALINTITIALLAATASTLLGSIAAIGIFNLKARSRKAIGFVNSIPILNGDIITGISLFLLFVSLGITQGYTTVVLAHITFCTPYVVLSVLPRLKQMNPNIYEAALDSVALSWDCLWNKKYAGKILMKDSYRDAYGTAVIYAHAKELKEGTVTVEELMNDYSPRAMELAEKYLKALKPNIAGWEADFGKEMMTKNKAWLNMTWSGDAIWAIEEANAVGVDLDYEVPEEGSNIWYDGWVIPKYARNPEAASYFINFMCRPDIALRNMDFCGYVSSIATPEILEEKIDTTLHYYSDLSYFFGPGADSVQIDKIQYPDRKVVERCAMIRDFGDKTKEVLDIWSRIKGDNLGVGITILIFVVVALMSGWMIYKKWQRYNRQKQQRRRSRRKKVRRN